jgi:hypothetical protein
MANEDLVLECDTFAEKGVARDFAAVAYFHALLDFDEGADFGAVANLTAVEVYERENTDVTTQFNVRSDALVGLHGSSVCYVLRDA